MGPLADPADPADPARPADRVSGPVSCGTPVLGRVVAFDPVRGLGEVEGVDGTRAPFHATAVADGSRRVEVGAAVSWLLAPGHGGRLEVRALVPLPPAAGAGGPGPADLEEPRT